MMKNIITQVEENMSNLTSASNEASASSSNRNDNNGAAMFSPQYNFPPPSLTQTQSQSQPQPQLPVKKKRNQPGHPDPEAEVIALSPRSLLATNRFVCEICNKGFQRDQNLQLHRRGHNLPWKLKQRTNKDIIRKKVYVCPETSCVHHEASRALGDLTGIKKHFCRKHGEKKWKCEKCSKKYAVQSDWKAHSKTCGTREYRCDCGTLFSRRDSFITHRAFCDALAEESARPILSAAKNTNNNIINIPSLLHHQTPPNDHHHLQQIQSQFIINNPNHHDHHQLPIFPPIKKEQQNFMMSPRTADNNIPPWLSPTYNFPAGGPPTPPPPPPSIFQDFHQNPNPNNIIIGTTTTQQQMGAGAPLLPPYHHPPPPAHFSATALLQKAAQMGAKSSDIPPSPACVFTRPHQQPAHVSAGGHGSTATTVVATTTGFGLNLSSSRDDGFINGLPSSSSYGNKAAASVMTGGSTTTVTAGGGTSSHNNSNPHNYHQSFLFHDMMMMGNPGTFDHDHDQGSSAFDHHEDMTFGGMLMSHASIKKDDGDEDDQESLDFHAALGLDDHQFSRRNHDGRNNNIESGGGGIINHDDGMTRDFLGLRALSQSDILSIAGFSNCMDNNNNNNNNNNACNDQH